MEKNERNVVAVEVLGHSSSRGQSQTMADIGCFKGWLNLLKIAKQKRFERSELKKSKTVCGVHHETINLDSVDPHNGHTGNIAELEEVRQRVASYLDSGAIVILHH